MCELADPAVDPSVKLDAFVALKRNEQFQLHRQQMERNGQECEKCGMLFVRNDSKPWTMVGTCSKVCCAAKFGVSDYALVEDEVAEQSRRISPEMKKRQRSNLVIHVECPACQHHFDLPKMYGGVYRKCPACQEKVLVPTA